jgi:hypothetical protein
MTVGVKQMRELVYHHPVPQQVCLGPGLVDVKVDSIAAPAHDLSPRHRLADLVCGYH